MSSLALSRVKPTTAHPTSVAVELRVFLLFHGTVDDIWHVFCLASKWLTCCYMFQLNCIKISLWFLTNIFKKNNSVLYLNIAFSFQVFERREHVNLWSVAFLVITAVRVLYAPGRNKYGTAKFVKPKVHILQNRHAFYYGRRINLGVSFNR